MSLMIKELPNSLKPRERLKEVGVASLSDEELIAIILRCGTKYQNVKEVALNLLNEVKDLSLLPNLSLKTLSKIKGIGEVKAITILASIELGKRVYHPVNNLNIVLNNTGLVYETFKNLFINEKQEKFVVLFLDIKKKLITFKTIFTGTIDQSLIHPREIFKESFLKSASFIICLHNHPSGNPNPSSADNLVTENIKKVSEITMIPLLDHIIIADDSYYSYLEHGLL